MRNFALLLLEQFQHTLTGFVGHRDALPGCDRLRSLEPFEDVALFPVGSGLRFEDGSDRRIAADRRAVEMLARAQPKLLAVQFEIRPNRDFRRGPVSRTRKFRDPDLEGAGTAVIGVILPFLLVI